MRWGPVILVVATALGAACAREHTLNYPAAPRGPANARAPNDSVVFQALPPEVASTLASAEAEPAGPRYREPQCAEHRGMRWPVTRGVANELANFKSEPRDQEWAPRAENYLRKQLASTPSRPIDRQVFVECRRSACVVGAIAGAGGAIFDALGRVQWAGRNGDAGGYAVRPDNCYDALYVFWRNGLDYPGAPGGRITSLQPMPPCPDSTPAAAGVSCIEWHGRCFKNAEAYCRCRCWLVPGASHSHPSCVKEPAAVGCAQGGWHFGMQWPPRWVP